MKNIKGQIWVETVLYTLIAFVLIGLVIAFAKPKIEESQDRAVIEQSIKVLDEVGQVIKNIGGPGNQRIIIIKIGKGALNIDGENDTLFFDIESKYVYSEYGEKISIGDISAFTEKKGGTNKITLIENYSANYNLFYNNKNETGKITKSQTPYKLFIANTGESEGRKNINIEIIN